MAETSKPQFVIRPAQFSDLVQINEIYNFYIAKYPAQFVDERSSIPLVDHVNLLAKTRQKGSVFDVVVNPDKQNEVYGWRALIPSTYRGVRLPDHVVSMLFVRHDKRNMGIYEKVLIKNVLYLQNQPWFIGWIGETNPENKRITKKVDQYSESMQPRILYKNVAYKFGEWQNMQVEFVTKEDCKRFTQQFIQPKSKL